MTMDSSRRTALLGFGSLAVGVAALAAGPSCAATTQHILPPGAREASDLMERLRKSYYESGRAAETSPRK